MRLVIASIDVDPVAKTYDEIYVLSIIRIYSFHLFSLLRQRKPNCWKYRKWCRYFENPYHDAKILDKRKKKVSRRELNRLHCDRARISVLKYCQYYSGYLLACRKWELKQLNKKVCSNFFLSVVPILGHWQGGSLTYPMLITALFQVRPDGHGETCYPTMSLSLKVY